MSNVYVDSFHRLGIDADADTLRAAVKYDQIGRAKAAALKAVDVTRLNEIKKLAKQLAEYDTRHARNVWFNALRKQGGPAWADVPDDVKAKVASIHEKQIHEEIDTAQRIGVPREKREETMSDNTNVRDVVREEVSAALADIPVGRQVPPAPSTEGSAKEWFYNALRDPRAALTGSGDGSGLIPQRVTDEIWYQLTNLVALTRAGARVVRLPNGAYKVPAETTAATAYWLAESAEITDAASVFGDASVEAHSIKALLSVSNEMLEDQPEYTQSAVMRSLTDALYRSMESAFLTGSGSSNEPEGIFTASGVTSTDLTGTTLTIDHVLDAYFDVLGKGADPANMVMILHPQAASYLEKLRENDGQTSEGGYLAGTAAPLFRDMRWIVTENAPYTDDTTDNASIIIGDVSRAVTLYEFGQWRMNVDASAAFSSDATMFRTVARMDVGIRQPTLLHKLSTADLG